MFVLILPRDRVSGQAPVSLRLDFPRPTCLTLLHSNLTPSGSPILAASFSAQATFRSGAEGDGVMGNVLRGAY